MMSSEMNAKNPHTTTGAGDFNNDTALSDFTDEDISPMSAIERGESGASLPNAEEVRATVYAEQLNDNARKNNGRRCCGCSKKMMILTFVLLAVVALSVGLGVGLSNRAENQETAAAATSSLDKNGNPTTAEATDKTPSADANAGPAPRLSTYTDIKNYVVAQGISLESDFATANSPQARAAFWMAEVDGFNVAIPKSSDPSNIIATATNIVVPSSDPYRFMARYILTVLYYATNGENWKYQFNFLTENDVCTWQGALVSSTSMSYIHFGTFCDNNGAIWAIYLDRLGLQGDIPKELGMLTTLELLDLKFNSGLGGEFPEELCQLTNLSALFLGYTQIMGEIPACIGQLSKLNAFFMSNTLMGGPIPSEFSQLTNMEILLLDDNTFTGDITSIFNEMTAIQYLFLEDNDLEATLDENFLADLKNLTQLDLSDNNIQGTIPAHLFDVTAHPRMQLLDLHGNDMSGSLPNMSESNGFMLFVALQDNSITGNVPTTWAQFLPKLFHLDLSNNLLDGPMLTDIGNMMSLRYLFLADNVFDEGPIPSSYANLTVLEEISLKRTQRNGNFPTFIATAWPALVLLDLDNNALMGPIPEALGNLTNLEFLLINRNQLSGTIPASLGNLINLRAVFMEQNQLTGMVDDTICELPAFALVNGINVGNPIMVADCGTTESVPTRLVNCSCCAICCTPGVDNCHDENEIANLNPEWEIGYKRLSFNFGNRSHFVDSDFLFRHRD